MSISRDMIWAFQDPVPISPSFCKTIPHQPSQVLASLICVPTAPFKQPSESMFSIYNLIYVVFFFCSPTPTGQWVGNSRMHAPDILLSPLPADSLLLATLAAVKMYLSPNLKPEHRTSH